MSGNGTTGGQPEVSVLPLYGQHRGRHTLPAVCRAWLAQDVPTEVVVATAGELALCLPEPADAVTVVRGPTTATAPGLLRNIAAQRTRAPMLYLSDSDVLPLGRGFLRRAIELAGDAAVAQPWMYRLADARTLAGPTEPVDWQPPVGRRACFVRLDQAAGAGGRLRRTGREAFFEADGCPVVVPLPDTVDGQPIDPADAMVPYHYGGLLLSAATFTAVGGYCEKYSGWGAEDDDLLVKLESRLAVHRAWRVDAGPCCLHIEHPRVYRHEQEANRAILARRTAAGPAAMIAEDAPGPPGSRHEPVPQPARGAGWATRS